MAVSMAETLARRALNFNSVSQAHRDVVDDRYRDLRRARKVRFFVNGDRYFKGKKLYITPHRYFNFNDLLNDLTGKLPTYTSLPYGVRQIFTPSTGRRVVDIEDLKDGHAYICAGFEGFKPIKYGKAALEPWSLVLVPHSIHLAEGRDAPLGEPGRTKKAHHQQHETNYETDQNSTQGMHYRPKLYGNAFRPGRYIQGKDNGLSSHYRKLPGAFGPPGRSSYLATIENQVPLKPKVITIVRNGPKPRNNVKILLNRKSAQSFEQLMGDISDAFGPKWKNNKIRKLFTPKGCEVQGVGDFFRDDDVFIGVGNEQLTETDVYAIIEEIYPDSPYAKNIMADFEKRKKKRIAQMSKDQYKDNDADKRDSGFGEGSDHDQEYILYKGRPSEKGKRRTEYPRDVEVAMRLDREKEKAAEDEKERIQKQRNKIVDSERRALEDENRKRRQVPKGQVADPFRKFTEQQKDKAREERRRRDEVKKKEDDEDKLRKEDDNKKRDKENQDQEPVEHVRVRQALPDKAEKEKKAANEKELREIEQAKERDLKELKDRHNKEKESPYSDGQKEHGHHHHHHHKDDHQEKLEDSKEKDVQKELGHHHHHHHKDDHQEKLEDSKEKDGQKELGHHHHHHHKNDHQEKLEDSKGKETDKEAHVDQKSDKTHKIENIDKNNIETKRKKPKPRIIRKTKLERQISGDDHVLSKYEMGRTLGDGNFAIVRISKMKATGIEYAIKVIDKAKLKGKEHMVENEIEIMKDCNHPNIVKLYEEFETADKIYLVMELVKGGDLFDAITQSVKFGEVDAAHMVKDLCSALFYLHSRVVVHRDLKPENLLVHRNKDMTISLKLADFGLAMDVKEPIFTVCGTPTYVAPEILSEIGYGLEVDMWAVGVITYILLCGFPPFRSPDRNQTELFEFIKAGEYEFLSPYWDNISSMAKDLIQHLLVVDKKKRYTAIDVLCHPWIICGGDVSGMDSSKVDEIKKTSRKVLDSQALLNKESYMKMKEKRAQNG